MTPQFGRGEGKRADALPRERDAALPGVAGDLFIRGGMQAACEQGKLTPGEQADGRIGPFRSARRRRRWKRRAP